MASHVSRLTRTLLVLLVAATGVTVAVPGATAAPPKPRPRIAFEGGEPDVQVVVSRPDGTRQRLLTSGPSWANQPRWSPFGKRILYLRRTPNEQIDLMVMGARGRHKHQLLSGRNRYISDMAWGPGGRRIALTMERAADRVSDVFIYSLRTGKLTKLHALGDPNRDPVTVDWSRSNNAIAFSAWDYTDEDNEDSDVYLIRPDGTGLRQLTNTPAPRDEYRPRWSPDGRHLAYTRWSRACENSVVIASADGTDPRRVRSGCAFHHPTWSSNGRRLLVEKYDRRGLEMIWSMALDGSDRRYVTHGLNAEWRPR